MNKPERRRNRLREPRRRGHTEEQGHQGPGSASPRLGRERRALRVAWLQPWPSGPGGRGGRGGRGVAGPQEGKRGVASRAESPVAGSDTAARPRGMRAPCEPQAQPEQPAALPPSPPALSKCPHGVSRARATTDPQPDGIGPRGRAQGFRSSEEGGPGADSPAGAAVAAEVPEVPEGAPKLKAMSREQRLGCPELPGSRGAPGRSVLTALPPGRETRAVSLVPPPLWPDGNAPPPVLLTSGGVLWLQVVWGVTTKGRSGGSRCGGLPAGS